MAVLSAAARSLEELKPRSSYGIWGYTATGKTTLLKSMLRHAAPAPRSLAVITSPGAAREYDEFSPLYLENHSPDRAPHLMPTRFVIFDNFRVGREVWLQETVERLKATGSTVLVAEQVNIDLVDFDVNVVLGRYGQRSLSATFGSDGGWGDATVPLAKGWGLVAHAGASPVPFSFDA